MSDHWSDKLKEVLKAHEFSFYKSGGKGGHEKWRNKNNKTITVPNNTELSNAVPQNMG